MDLIGIKNILFDLGGVLVDIFPKKPVEYFKKTGLSVIQDYEQLMKTEIFENFETGRIHASEFRQLIRIQTGMPLSDEDIDKAWNSMIDNFDLERIRLLEKLKGSFRLFLLSNTNEIHVEYFSQNFARLTKYPFEKLFDKVYYSHQLGMRKPDLKIFKKVLKDACIQPHETLFIDDTEANIKAASLTGLKIKWLHSGENLTCLFSDLQF